MKKFVYKFKEHFSETFNKIGNFIPWILGKSCALLIWLLCLSLITIILLLAYNIIQPKVTRLYSHACAVSELQIENLSPQDKKSIDTLIAKNKIIPISTIYEKTLEYYDSLVSILIALLGIFAFVTWFSLRGKTKDEVENAIEKMIESPLFKAWINENLDIIVQEKLPDKEQLIEDLKERVSNNLEKDKEFKLGQKKTEDKK